MTPDTIYMVRNRVTGLYSRGGNEWGTFRAAKIWRGRGPLIRFFQLQERTLEALHTHPERFDEYRARLDFENLEILSFSVAVPKTITPATELSLGRHNHDFKPFRFLGSASLRQETA